MQMADRNISKILESEYTIEKLQFKSFESIINCIALYMIIS